MSTAPTSTDPTADHEVTVRCWGVRGSHPTPGPSMHRYGGNTACVEVRTPEGRIIIDAGTGIIGLGREIAAAEPAGTDLQLLVSHLHWDHLQGLPFLAPLYRGMTLHVWSHGDPGAAEAAVRLQFQPPYFPVDLEELPVRVEARSLGDETQIGDAKVTPFPLRHPGGSTGFLIESAGRRVVYASDHELGDPATDAGLLQAARGADLLLLDAQYDETTYAEHRGWGHSSWERAVDFGREANVGRLLLFHHAPEADDDRLDAVGTAASHRWSRAEVARESEPYRL